MFRRNGGTRGGVGGRRAYSSETRLLPLGGEEEGESTFQEWFYSDDSALGILPQ